MLIEVIPTGPFQAHAILLGDAEEGPLAIIDPGDEDERLLERVEHHGRQVAMILLTHAHIDHAGAVAPLRAALGAEVPILMHPDERPLYDNLPQQGQLFGLEATPPPPPDGELTHGQRLSLGGLCLEVRHTPGHSPGGVSFVVHGGPGPLAIVGDLVFRGSIGRTDLWGGSQEVLLDSLRREILSLPDETTLVPGHGPTTTVGQERATNPFVVGLGER